MDQDSFIQKNWKLIVGGVAIAGWLLAGLFGYSLKETKKEFADFKSTHNSIEKIKEPVELPSGKIEYRYIDRVVNDTVSNKTGKESEKIWKSGVSLGVLYGLNDKQVGGYIIPDLLPIGPGTVQANVTGFENNIFVGGGYRILF